MTEIYVDHVWKRQGPSVILENINLLVQGPEFCTIIGPSGSGKSTFLRLLLSADKPSQGNIYLDGKPLPSEPTPERGIVFQRYSVFPHLTVLKNVLLGFELRQSAFGWLFGKKRKQAIMASEKILNDVGLSAFTHHYPAALSGGMQQRLALAQSIAMRPKILLLDEPFAALDPGIRDDMQQLVLRIWQETQMMIFMVTHDMQEAFLLGTRVLVFDRPKATRQNGATIVYDIKTKPFARPR